LGRIGQGLLHLLARAVAQRLDGDQALLQFIGTEDQR
jgi:hypothetical protein